MTPPVATEVRLRYEPAPEPAADDTSFRLRLRTDGVRAGAGLTADLQRPGVVRDALLTLSDVLRSDLRFRPQSRADYLAYLLKSGKRVSQEVWNAQKAFLASKYGEDAADEAPLDPVISVDERGLSFEVFSADESVYGRLFLRNGEAYKASRVDPGTSHVRLDDDFMRAVSRIRSYRASGIEIEPSAAGTEKVVRVPYRWLRAFAQVQAASTLPSTRFEIAPVDLYNVLLSLRMHRARKAPRALRYELVPGEVPRLVLEPWERVIPATGAPYDGPTPQVVRTWGRTRLAVLGRVLPHARSVRIELVGPGLPAFYVLDLGDATLALALSGWTDSGWSGLASFDLVGNGEVDEVLARDVMRRLSEGPKRLAELNGQSGRSREDVRRALLHDMQRGLVLYDIVSEQFVQRPLLAEPTAAEHMRFRDAREAEAHRLLETADAVRLTRVHDLGAEGTRIEGEVHDAKAHRTYLTTFTIDREGRAVDANCTSPQFRRAGLREGPTVPMLALRLAYGRQREQLERARGTAEGRKLIRAETRTLVRRSNSGSTTYRVSLDDREVTVRWGPRPDAMRMTRQFFSDAEQARTEYFARLQGLIDKGYIDATAAEII